MATYLELGSWNTICDRCGFEFKSHQLRKEWTGLMVCKCCWESRHPQDFIRVRPERSPIPWSRPEAADVFLTVEDFWATETGEYIVDEIEQPFSSS